MGLAEHREQDDGKYVKKVSRERGDWARLFYFTSGDIYGIEGPFDSRAKPPPAKRSEKDYGDENGTLSEQREAREG